MQAATIISGTTYTFAATYDANSGLSQLNYPTGFALNYTYTSLGYSSQLTGFAGRGGATKGWSNVPDGPGAIPVSIKKFPAPVRGAFG